MKTKHKIEIAEIFSSTQQLANSFIGKNTKVSSTMKQFLEKEPILESKFKSKSSLNRVNSKPRANTRKSLFKTLGP